MSKIYISGAISGMPIEEAKQSRCVHRTSYSSVAKNGNNLSSLMFLIPFKNNF